MCFVIFESVICSHCDAYAIFKEPKSFWVINVESFTNKLFKNIPNFSFFNSWKKSIPVHKQQLKIRIFLTATQHNKTQRDQQKYFQLDDT